MFYKAVRFIARIAMYLFFRMKFEGLDNVPPQGPIVLCSNHSTWIDPVWIAICFPRRIFFMAKEELFSNSIFGFLITNVGAFPVKRGTPDRKAIRSAIELLNQQRVLGIFPEGTRSRAGNLGEAQNGAAYLALKTGSPILPVTVRGSLKFRASVQVKYGTLITFDDLDGRVSSHNLAIVNERLMSALAKGL